MKLAETNLFKPITLTNEVSLSHRIVMPPLTRERCFADGVPVNYMVQYYDERSRTPGTLLIAEATYVDVSGIGRPGAPGVYTETQQKAWKHVVDKVHANKSYISLQLWHLGYDSDPRVLKEAGVKFRAPSATIYKNAESEQLAKSCKNPLVQFTTQEIKDLIQTYAENAEKAIKVCGFDMVEVHGAHGYLIDQFTNALTNQRTDEYGGSIENRARFFLEIVDAISAKIGNSKLAMRISPWAQALNMPGVTAEIHPYVTYGYLFSELQKRNKKSPFAYLSIVEPRIRLSRDADPNTEKEYSNQFVYDIYKGIILRTGNYIWIKEPEKFDDLIKDVNDNDRTLIGIGRFYISNPDLVERLRKGQSLVPYEREYFYGGNNLGYNTYSRYGETVDVKALVEQEKVRLA